MKKDVVGMDRPGSEDYDDRTDEPFAWQVWGYVQALEERVAVLEELLDDTRTCYKDCFRRVARLERIIEPLLHGHGWPATEPIPWGDLD